MEDLYLIAHIADRTVAIRSAQVDSVVDIGDIVRVPRAPRSVIGLAALRSRVVTVIDTRQALGLGGVTGAGRAIIVHDEGHYYAMLVDALDDISPFVRQPLASGIGLSSAWRTVALGLIERDGEPVLAIDLLGLIPRIVAAAA